MFKNDTNLLNKKWESQVAIVQIPWRLKLNLQARLSDMVSEWAGVPVEETVMYGLRQYQNGARVSLCLCVLYYYNFCCCLYIHVCTWLFTYNTLYSLH